MYFLVRTFLPYLMIAAGVLGLAVAAPVIVAGNETAPTTIALADIATTKARWLRVKGRLDLAEAIVDEEINTKTGAKKDKAWYVPLVPADAPAAVPATTLSGAGTNASRVVLVKYGVDEYLRRYPLPERVSIADMPRIEDVVGVRSSNLTFPQRLKDFVRAEMKLPLERVIVLDHGDTPLQRGPATVIGAAALGLATGGVLLARARRRRRQATA